MSVHALYHDSIDCINQNTNRSGMISARRLFQTSFSAFKMMIFKIFDDTPLQGLVLSALLTFVKIRHCFILRY